MREIGGYFEFEHFNGREYYSDLVGLNTARNALLYILRARKIQKIHIPYFLCDCIRIMLEKFGFAFEFYSIDESMLPIFDKNLEENECIYIVNYYGRFNDEVLKGLQAKYKNIIVDNVQAFFRVPIQGIDTLYSCRKFFGVPDGAYVSTAVPYTEDIESDVSKSRMEHILGRYEHTASEFYSVFKKVDDSFIEEDVKSMSSLTRNLLRGINYESVARIREENFDLLHSVLGDINQIDIGKPNAPFCYPFYNPNIIKNPLELKRNLANKKIYIPTYWPNVLEENGKDTLEYQYAYHILALPCDQRYGKEEMMYMLEALKEYCLW